MYEKIFAHLDACTALSVEQKELFSQNLQHKIYPKKAMLLTEGEVCKFEGFINRGCVRIYFTNSEGQEVILSFAIENWWISDLVSFQDQKPSKMNIETLEETEMLMLNPASKEKVLQDIPALERMYRLMVQRHLGTYQDRLFANIGLQAEERYHIFLQKYPSLSQRIPQHYIAAYLGISPEFLSRIRTRKA
jgi:CRP/FNR family transcriptional regulator, cyclic AMP receptor protein